MVDHCCDAIGIDDKERHDHLLCPIGKTDNNCTRRGLEPILEVRKKKVRPARPQAATDVLGFWHPAVLHRSPLSGTGYFYTAGGPSPFQDFSANTAARGTTGSGLLPEGSISCQLGGDCPQAHRAATWAAARHDRATTQHAPGCPKPPARSGAHPPPSFTPASLPHPHFSECQLPAPAPPSCLLAQANGSSDGASEGSAAAG